MKVLIPSNTANHIADAISVLIIAVTFFLLFFCFFFKIMQPYFRVTKIRVDEHSKC